MSKITVDGNTACALMAYLTNDFSAIYPITPSSAMAEACDEWANKGMKNIFNQPLTIQEMQSEAGVSGALHGSLSMGVLSTTFTASQGLLLMIPNMYKIAGENLPCVFHVSARAIATHALSIFGDHSDVMACTSTGFNMICSTSVQECQDMALACQIASLNSSLPFLHFFDGFRTSHEIQKIDEITPEDIKKIFPFDAYNKFKMRSLSNSNPIQKGTAQNPDVYFQNREKSNILYNNVYSHIINAFSDIERITNRHYAPYEYFGASDAEEIVIAMGSSTKTLKEVATNLNNHGRKVGVINIRVFLPWNDLDFVKIIPSTAKIITVLDRTKQSGAICEPLCACVMSSLQKHNLNIKVLGGRYGLGGKEFTPSHAYSVFENMKKPTPKNNFSVGINDDVCNSSLEQTKYSLSECCYQMKFYGLGSDGTVSANKNSIKIIGNSTSKFVQGYFEYDSKKSGSMTISHLRISDNEINMPYNVENADFIAIHNFSFVNRYSLLDELNNNGIVLLNTAVQKENLDSVLPLSFKQKLKQTNSKLYIIDAESIAKECGLNNKINVIMQTAFFKLLNIVEYSQIKNNLIEAIYKTYSKKGEIIVKNNINALELAENQITQVDINTFTNTDKSNKPIKINHDFYEKIIKIVESRKGNSLPVSCFSSDGSIPTSTSKFLKRGIALSNPKWISENCIQCGQCSLACPHSAIKSVVTKKENIKNCPDGFKYANALGMKDCIYSLQISEKDCTGCGVCANVCPALKKALKMQKSEDMDKTQEIYNYTINLPKEQNIFNKFTPKGLQFEQPYFEFNFACAGCGETPYINLATRLFGNKMIIANATGCSSIYGGSYPACPYTVNKNGFGPSWANSLFEDNAEFGMGMVIAQRTKRQKLYELIKQYLNQDNDSPLAQILECWLIKNDLNEEEFKKLENLLQTSQNELAQQIYIERDSLIKKSFWIVGGDGWAYDIGYSGLDHVLCSNENVNILVLDSEVYSNTGGQISKSSPQGIFAKFANSGKNTKKKDLGLISIANRNCYVASISLGANTMQAIKALKEAEEFDGPSLIIAYSPCTNHGFDMSKSNEHMKLAVECGYWNLYRYNPISNELSLDSLEPTRDYIDFLRSESRYTALEKQNPEKAQELFIQSKQNAINRLNLLKKLKNNE